jgi:hypothetical protein
MSAAGRRSGDKTDRETIVELLEGTSEPLTLRDISQLAGLPEKEVLDHLDHIHRSMKTHSRGITVTPARCRSCGFSFAKRGDFKKPSRCPVCKSEFISPPAYSI